MFTFSSNSSLEVRYQQGCATKCTPSVVTNYYGEKTKVECCQTDNCNTYPDQFVTTTTTEYSSTVSINYANRFGSELKHVFAITLYFLFTKF